MERKARLSRRQASVAQPDLMDAGEARSFWLSCFHIPALMQMTASYCTIERAGQLYRSTTRPGLPAAESSSTKPQARARLRVGVSCCRFLSHADGIAE